MTTVTYKPISAKTTTLSTIVAGEWFKYSHSGEIYLCYRVGWGTLYPDRAQVWHALMFLESGEPAPVQLACDSEEVYILDVDITWRNRV